MLTEDELLSGKTCEVGEYHIWYHNYRFRVSLDWSESKGPINLFKTYAELVNFVGEGESVAH